MGLCIGRKEGKPVAYASKSLSPTEQDYPQIEKEDVRNSIWYGAFSNTFMANKLKLPQPLEATLRKPLSEAPARLQRIMLRLQKYDLTVRHKPGKEIPVADTLPHLHLSETDGTHEAFDAQVYLAVANLPVPDQMMSDLQASTASDPVM